MTQPAVGLIGLGLMGGGMGRNLLRRGYPLTVHDIDPAAVARLVERGAVAAESPRAVAARSRFVITVLPDGPQVEAALTGADGILAGAAPGTIVVDCSTIDPLVTRRLDAAARAAGCHLVDAAMGRSSKEAEEGRLIFMVGAMAEVYATVEPLLAAMGTDLFHCGQPGAGITMKLVNNLLNLSLIAADVEALALGVRAGLPIDVMMRVLTTTASDNALLHSIVPNHVLTGDYTPGFKLALAHKDVGLAQNLAARLGVPLFTLAPARQLYSLALTRGLGDQSHGAIATVLEDLLGIRLARQPSGHT